jgi:hypothetical protein
VSCFVLLFNRLILAGCYSLFYVRGGTVFTAIGGVFTELGIQVTSISETVTRVVTRRSGGGGGCQFGV